MDFDPDKDAARIETAIKTKGKLHRRYTWTKQTVDVALLHTEELLVFVSQRVGSGFLGRAGEASNLCVGRTQLWLLTGSHWQQSQHQLWF